MSIIIGIICTDGIVMASDSQMTAGERKDATIKKLYEIKRGTERILAAESGAVIYSRALLEYLRSRVSLNDGRHWADMLKDSNFKLWEELRNYHFSCTSEALLEIITKQQLAANVTLGYYDGEKPRLETATLGQAVVHRSIKRYDALGTGSDMAMFFLNDLWLDTMDCATSAVIAAYIIEAVNSHYLYCSGDVQLGILPAPKKSDPDDLGLELKGDLILPDYKIYQTIQIVRKIESETQKTRGNLIRDALKEQGDELRKMFLNMMYVEPRPMPPKVPSV